MGMGIVSNDEFDLEKSKLVPREESNSISPAKQGEIIDMPPKGRGKGDLAVPNSLRKVIGEESAINGRESALEIAQNFGISPSSVSAYANGSTSTASYDEQPNLSAINEGKARVAKRARNKLMSALKHITPTKLADAKVRDLAGIARDMSAVVKNMEPDTPKSPTGGTGGPTFVFYAPQFRDERSFDVVQAKE